MIKIPSSTVPASGTTGTTPALQPTKSTGATGTSPALPSDRFAAGNKAVAQLTGRDAVRTPGQLTSNLGKVVDPQELPDRLTSDLAVHLPELVSLLSLTRQQKATRLIEFLVPYAAKLAELAPEAALQQTARAQLEQKLLEPMANAGLEHVVELTTGKTGVDVARELLRSATADEARALTASMSFDAPTWAARPETAAASEVKRGEPTLMAQPALQPAREHRSSGRAAPEEERALKDRGDKSLGKNMVWNVLHMFRDTSDAPADEKKQKELLMATGGIIVLVITVALVVVLALVLGK